MGLQKYRADKAGHKQSNGSQAWFSSWVGGPTLTLIRNCPTEHGPRTVYVRGEPDSYTTQPAAHYLKVKGKTTTITGYITGDDNGEYVFRAHKEQ